MKLSYLFSVFLLLCSAFGQNPLSDCEGGEAVPYTLAASGGACGLPTIGIPPAYLDQTHYAGGASCGVCYQVTGPMGVQIVQILDICGSSNYRCGGSEATFGIDDSTFDLLANRTDVDVIYDLGYRQVTCEVTGNVQMKAVSAVPSQINYFFSLEFWNFRVGITQVRVQGSGWSSYELLTRQGTSAIWSWNKNNNNLAFPLAIYLVGMTDELIKYSVTSLTQGTQVDFGVQFTDVDGGHGVCPMSSSPAVIYNGTVSYGWDTSFSFRPVSINLNDTSNTFQGMSSINVQLYPQGGLQFTRTGGFDPLYFSYLTFAAMSTGNVDIRVYMGDGTGPLSATVQVPSNWTVYNISVSSLTNNSLETALVFFNADNSQVQLWFNNIRWVLNPISPVENITQITTTGNFQFNTSSTTSEPVLISTSSSSSGTTGFGGGNTSSAFVTTTNIVSIFSALLLILVFLQ